MSPIHLALSFLCFTPLLHAQQSGDPSTAQSPPTVGLEHHRDMLAQPAPSVSFTSKSDGEITLDSYRGHPLLIDIWATWCGPCLKALPAINRLYAEFKNKGLQVVSFDQDGEDGTEGDETTAAKYLARHHYQWANFHDFDRKVALAFQADGLPLVVLIDPNGDIVYFGFGGERADSDLRKALAKLGTEYAPSSRASSR